MYIKQPLVLAAILLLTCNIFALCPGTYFKTVKTQALSTPLFDNWYVDVDGDGKKDLLGLSHKSSVQGPNDIVFYKRSAGGFDIPPVITSLGANFRALRITTGDVNGDGKIDIFLQNPSPTGSIGVYLNNGSGGFSLAGGSTTLSSETMMAYTADLNLDGKDDLISVENLSSTCMLSYHPGQADGSFGAKIAIVGNTNGNNPVLGFGDIDGNGKVDVFGYYKPFFMQPSFGVVAQNSGGAFTFGSTPGLPAPATVMKDLNADGIPDAITGLYLQNNAAFFKYYYFAPVRGGDPVLFSKTIASGQALVATDPPLSPQAGNFNDDAAADVMYQGARNYLMEENDGLGGFTEKSYSPPVSGTADEFSGDGKLDIVSFNRAILIDNGESIQSVTLKENVCAPSGQTTFVDFDKDGQTDMGAWRASDGRWRWRDADKVNHDFFWGANGDIPVPQDFDGDSRTDYAVFRPSNGAWYIFRSSDAQVSIVPFGTAGDKPVPSDFDGDGKADLAVFRPATGTWYVWQSATNSLYAANWGLNGDVPLPMDYDGDGRSDLTVFRPSNGAWYEFLSATSSVAIYAFGLSTDKPVPADFDGDGRADVAVFRDGFWYILRSSDNVFFVTLFGTAGDTPFATHNTQKGRGTSLTVFRPGNTTVYDYQIEFFGYPDMAGNRIISSILPLE